MRAAKAASQSDGGVEKFDAMQLTAGGRRRMVEASFIRRKVEQI
jgi:hypothetical protein